MIALIPLWASHYNEFWQQIRNRNLLFIKLRYAAVFMLFAILAGAELIIGFKLTGTQLLNLSLINTAILFYNIIFHSIRRYVRFSNDSFNPVHLSILQMGADLIAISLMIYYTGTIESPLSLFFIFHLVFGSLILPGIIIYSTALWVLFNYSSLTVMEYLGIIEHHAVAGLLTVPLYNNYKYIVTALGGFTFIVSLSVILTNRIAKQLYKMEQDLVESLEKLNKVEIEKQKYIMGIVHEIKTPLAAIHSYLDLLLTKILGELNEKVEEKIIRAKHRSDEAIDMVNSVLKISRIKLLEEMPHEEIVVNKLIKDVLQKQQAAIQFKSINVNIIEKDKDVLLFGNRTLLEMALSNIIGNAVKYSGFEGKIEIVILHTNDEIQLKICDDGIGIPPEETEKIFEELYRASNTKKTEHEGAGFGLSIVKQIIDKHVGKIKVISPAWLEHKNHPGTCFLITLPKK